MESVGLRIDKSERAIGRLIAPFGRTNTLATSVLCSSGTKEAGGCLAHLRARVSDTPNGNGAICGISANINIRFAKRAHAFVSTVRAPQGVRSRIEFGVKHLRPLLGHARDLLLFMCERHDAADSIRHRRTRPRNTMVFEFAIYRFAGIGGGGGQRLEGDGLGRVAGSWVTSNQTQTNESRRVY